MNTKTFKKSIFFSSIAALLLAVGMMSASVHASEGDPASMFMEDSNQTVGDTCQDLLSGDKEKISLDFQEIDIQNMFRIISEVSGLNVVLSPDVAGTLNVRMIDVSWNTALDLILENNLLGRECERDIIRIAPKTTLAAAKDLEPLSTKMVRINYADIDEMLKNLESIKSPERGTVTADVRTNTIILSDIPSRIEAMTAIIKTLDVRTPQVTIEARIVEVARSYAKELGVKWSGFSGARSKPYTGSFPADVNFGGGLSSGESIRLTGPGGVAGAPFDLSEGTIVDLGTSGAPTGAFGVLLASSNLNHVLDLKLQALEERGKTKTIANPRVTTLDNQEAVINSGERVPYITKSNEGTKTEFVDADIRLTMTPHITANEDIYMKIAAQQDAFDISQTVGGIPTITTKEASTEVLVNNGATTILGGLYQKVTSEGQGSVPYLSEIPLIGYLFRNTAESDAVVELLIFVTPTIVREYDTASR